MKVKFYKVHGEFLAVFPEQRFRNGYLGAYAHIGQHCEVSPEYLRKGQRVSIDDAADLWREVDSLYRSGPDPVILEPVPVPFQPFPKVSGRYGAPMGRANGRNGFEPDATLCAAGPVGEYDPGGAYWGIGNPDGPVWAVWERGHGKEGVIYVRAKGRESAKRKAREW